MVTIAVFLFLLAVVCAGGVGVFAVLGRVSPQLEAEGASRVVAWFARMTVTFAFAGVAVLVISALPSA